MSKFGDDLKQAATTFGESLESLPPDWKVARCISPPFELPTPADWERLPSDDPQRPGLLFSLVPEEACVSPGDDSASPTLTFWANGFSGVSEGECLDFFQSSLEMTFPNPIIVESERLSLLGVQTFVAVVDYSRPGGARWRCMVTLRVKENVYYLYEAKGFALDLSLYHDTYVAALANLRIGSSEQASSAKAIP